MIVAPLRLLMKSAFLPKIISSTFLTAELIMMLWLITCYRSTRFHPTDEALFPGRREHLPNDVPIIIPLFPFVKRIIAKTFMHVQHMSLLGIQVKNDNLEYFCAISTERLSSVIYRFKS